MILKAIFLGIIQGLTEFLPISSSGHLSIVDRILNNSEFNLLFFAVLHLGTMMAVILYYYKDILSLIISLKYIPESIKEKRIKDNYLRLLILIIIASIPTAIIGLLLKDSFDAMSENMVFVGSMLIITSLILFLGVFFKKEVYDVQSFSFSKSIVAGILQGIAAIPGISRSGLTITGLLFLKSKREFAGRFSFLMSLPAIAGINLLEFYELFKHNNENSSISGHLTDQYILLFTGFIAAFISGYIALSFLIKLVNKGKMYYFSIYCLIVGLLTMIFLK